MIGINNERYLPINKQEELAGLVGKGILLTEWYSKKDTVSIFMWGTLIYLSNYDEKYKGLNKTDSATYLTHAKSFIQNYNYLKNNSNWIELNVGGESKQMTDFSSFRTILFRN